MNIKDSYITQAMLASYLNNEKMDYLRLLTPFVLKCLPTEKGALVDSKAIQSQLNKEYQLNILYNVVEKMLQRLCKSNQNQYIRKDHGKYYVAKIYDDTEFSKRKANIKDAHQKVICALVEFLKNSKYIEKMTEDVAEIYLSTFLETYNYTVYENAECMNRITINNGKDKTNYYVAQFVLQEYYKESVIFDNVLEIIKGILVSKAIYFFMSDYKDDMQSKLKGTVFYLDTRLLIDALGLNLKEEQDAMLELLDLLKDNGGVIKTFNHYKTELEGIVYKYAKDVNCRLSLSLKKFSSERYSTHDVEMYLGTLESRLKEVGITCENKPDYDENINKNTWHIDYNALKNALSAQIEYKDKEGYGYDSPIINDTNTIEAIAYLRGTSYRFNIENCKCIFVTKNKDIVQVVNNLYYKERFCKGEINFAITDVDLTSLLWLSTFGKNSELPKLKLMENVYAACSPSNAVMNEFIRKINRMSDSNKISNETAILLRTQYSMYNDLSELTDNDSANVNDNVIKEMEARLINRERKKASEHAHSELKYIRDEVLKEKDEIAAAREKLEQEGRAINKKAEDTKIIEDRINIRKANIECENKEIEEKKKEIDKFKRQAINKVNGKAIFWSNVLKVVLSMIVMLMFGIIILLFSFGTFYLLNTQTKSLLVASTFTGLIAIICLIMSIWSAKKVFFIKIGKFSENIKDYIFDRELEKYPEIYYESI
ncbi:MAG: hypothetical protein ACYDEX_07940 [Mobilitalea sp.]